MSKEKNEQEIQEENQILQETVLNEKTITHPVFGTFLLKHPTLKDQKLIDSLTRSKKKELRMVMDEVADPNDPTKTIKVPAFESQEVLSRKFKELGWYTQEDEDSLAKATANYTKQVLELEILGFESEEEIFKSLKEINENLVSIFKDELTPEIQEAIDAICSARNPDSKYITLLTEEAPNSTVDDLINDTIHNRLLLQKLGEFVEAYQVYIRLQANHLALFSDSWQSQLEQITRLIQLYVCVKKEDGSPIWKSLAELEENQYSERDVWLLNEYLYFIRGIPDEVRDRMGKYGFFLSPPEEEESSELLPEEETSSPDGNSPERQLEAF